MFWENKKVVVTGCAGFIGSYLVEQLVGLSAQVIVVDNFERGRRENLVQVIEGDLQNILSL